MMNFFAALKPQTPADNLPELTERELEVLELLAQHLTNQEIADRLAISLKTARNHVSNILSKLQVADRTAAILQRPRCGHGVIIRQRTTDFGVDRLVAQATADSLPQMRRSSGGRCWAWAGAAASCRRGTTRLRQSRRLPV